MHMNYKSLQDCVQDLEANGHLIRIKEEVDPYLELSAIHLRVFKAGGPALLFEKVKGSRYAALSNLFGTVERSKFMFRKRFTTMQDLVQLRNHPMAAFKKPFQYLSTGVAAISALPKKAPFASAGFQEISISELPLITHWPMDGGAFVTLPQVYSEDPEAPGVMKSNVGMYRIQLSGNAYTLNEEIGLHYQLHRGIGVHQSKSNRLNQPLKVSVFVGGPPSHTLAAVMPLPEGISELTFAGALGGRRFRYAYADGYCVSLDADFVITGEVHPGENKPEGPFGDHLGYYSLQHPFPLMRVHKVYAKPGAIWPFTVVGRPPQEDTAFGALIHELSGSAIPNEIPGVKEVHAVDEAGVHPLLLAVGSERYTPYLSNERPAELLTQANRILGTGQLSLAKYLYIAGTPQGDLRCNDTRAFLKFVFERIDLTRDLHFYTRTTIDTLDYSGDSLNEGSKLVLAAYGPKKRELRHEVPAVMKSCVFVKEAVMLMEGVMGVKMAAYTTQENAKKEMNNLSVWLKNQGAELDGIVQIVVADENEFSKEASYFKDYLWIAYTRSNPAQDVYGVGEHTENKHWMCTGAMIVDARKKPHHAPELRMKEEVLTSIERFFAPGAVLSAWA